MGMVVKEVPEGPEKSSRDVLTEIAYSTASMRSRTLIPWHGGQ